MRIRDKNNIVDSYRRSFLQYGDSPEAVQWSADGQRWRFEKLIEFIAEASGDQILDKRILEIGCGLGHMYPLLTRLYGDIDYTGIDIVPELIERAKATHPKAKFECRDIFTSTLGREFDFCLISGVFNAPYLAKSREFMAEMLRIAFAACRFGLAFNFTSSHVNFVSEGTNYFDPVWVLSEILTNISKKVILQHHYNNCDVACYIGR